MTPEVPSYWRRTYGPQCWKELFFSLIGLPLGIAGFVFVVVSSALSVFLAITFVGVPILFVALNLDHWVGSGYRWLARSLLDLDLPEPPPRPSR